MEQQPEEHEYTTDEYTIAHCASYLCANHYVMLVKTVDGKIEYPSAIEGEPVIRFYVGVMPDNSPASQHAVVKTGVEIQQDSLKTFFSKKDY